MGSTGNLHGKTILVTGASSGIGRAIAIMAAARGARLVLHGQNVERLQDVLTTIGGVPHTIFARDLSEPDGLEAWLDTVVDSVGPLSGFVHSAGIATVAPLKITKFQAVEKMWRINVLSALLIAKAMRKANNRAPGASIVFISSVAGLRGNPGQISYSATKGALIGMTRSMAMELVRDDVRVNSVAPALVNTGMADAVAKGTSNAAFSETLKDHPLGIGEPGDVAEAVCFLLSGNSKWITGTTLSVDGGYIAGRV